MYYSLNIILHRKPLTPCPAKEIGAILLSQQKSKKKIKQGLTIRGLWLISDGQT